MDEEVKQGRIIGNTLILTRNTLIAFCRNKKKILFKIKQILYLMCVCVCVCVCVCQLLICVRLFATLWTVVRQTSVHEIFQARMASGLPFPSPDILDMQHLFIIEGAKRNYTKQSKSMQHIGGKIIKYFLNHSKQKYYYKLSIKQISAIQMNKAIDKRQMILTGSQIKT